MSNQRLYRDRADVSALVTREGQMLEWVKYSSYGVPFGLPGGDTNSDGDCDASDVNQVDTWVEQGPYDVRGDIDLNGNVDETDSSTISSDYSGITMGRGVLSDSGVRNRRGYAGYEFDGGVGEMYRVRHQTLGAHLGRWIGRSTVDYQGGALAYQYADSSPIRNAGTSLASNGPGDTCGTGSRTAFHCLGAQKEIVLYVAVFCLGSPTCSSSACRRSQGIAVGRTKLEWKEECKDFCNDYGVRCVPNSGAKTLHETCVPLKIPFPPPAMGYLSGSTYIAKVGGPCTCAILPKWRNVSSSRAVK